MGVECWCGGDGAIGSFHSIDTDGQRLIVIRWIGFIVLRGIRFIARLIATGIVFRFGDDNDADNSAVRFDVWNRSYNCARF